MKMNLDLGSPAAWWRWLRQWRLNQLVQTCDRVDVLDHVHDNGKLGPRYAFMTVMACGIAILGLLQNSAAVIIGAMLISPLMGPIVELGMGLATFDLRTIRGALKTLAVGIALALAIAMAIVWLSPLKEATGEILARTQPTFFDLLVAVFSGLAGAYATVTRKGETIVGVAIATALMPPLAVVGYGLAVANWNVAGGAAFLFMTNLLAIALSVTIVARLYGFGGSDSPKQTAWQASLIVASFLLLSIPLGLALKRIALQSQAELVVRGTLDRAATAASGRVSGLRVDTAEGRIAVDAVVTLPSHVTGLEAKLQEELKATLKQPVTVRVQEVLTSDDASFARQQGTLAELRRNITALQDAENVRSAQQRTQVEQRTEMQADLLPYLGRLERSPDGSLWTLWVSPDTRMRLARAERIETEVNAAKLDGEPPLRVVPPLQALPSIALPAAAGEAKGPGDAGLRELASQAWALQRWRASAVDLRLATRDDAQAEAWTAAARTALSARGVAVGEVTRERSGDVRLQLELPAP